jgi:hypothetical protein
MLFWGKYVASLAFLHSSFYYSIFSSSELNPAAAAAAVAFA